MDIDLRPRTRSAKTTLHKRLPQTRSSETRTAFCSSYLLPSLWAVVQYADRAVEQVTVSGGVPFVNPLETWRTPLCGLAFPGLGGEVFVVDG
jgi:hypothetical protein